LLSSVEFLYFKDVDVGNRCRLYKKKHGRNLFLMNIDFETTDVPWVIATITVSTVKFSCSRKSWSYLPVRCWMPKSNCTNIWLLRKTEHNYACVCHICLCGNCTGFISLYSIIFCNKYF